MRTFSVEVGRLLCGQMRDYLNAAKFRGLKIDYLESSGFLEREFTIRGEIEDMRKIERDLEAWFQEIASRKRS